MSGRTRKKKNGERTAKQSSARERDFEQPVLGSATKQRAQDTSNLTDADLAGPDWKRKEHADRD